MLAGEGGREGEDRSKEIRHTIMHMEGRERERALSRRQWGRLEHRKGSQEVPWFDKPVGEWESGSYSSNHVQPCAVSTYCVHRMLQSFSSLQILHQIKQHHL